MENTMKRMLLLGLGFFASLASAQFPPGHGVTPGATAPAEWQSTDDNTFKQPPGPRDDSRGPGYERTYTPNSIPDRVEEGHSVRMRDSPSNDRSARYEPPRSSSSGKTRKDNEQKTACGSSNCSNTSSRYEPSPDSRSRGVIGRRTPGYIGEWKDPRSSPSKSSSLPKKK